MNTAQWVYVCVTMVAILVLYFGIYRPRKLRRNKREWDQWVSGIRDRLHEQKLTFAVVIRDKSGRETGLETMLVGELIQAGANVRRLSKVEADEVWKARGDHMTGNFLVYGTTWLHHTGTSFTHSFFLDLRVVSPDGRRILGGRLVVATCDITTSCEDELVMRCLDYISGLHLQNSGNVSS